MSNLHHFGMGRGHLPKEAAKIAKKHGAELVNYVEPGTNVKRHWFNKANEGSPLDQHVAHMVFSDLRQARIIDKNGDHTPKPMGRNREPRPWEPGYKKR